MRPSEVLTPTTGMLLALSVLLTGCSGDDSTPAAAASTSATSTPGSSTRAGDPDWLKPGTPK